MFWIFLWKKCFHCGQSWHYFCPVCLSSLEIYQEMDYISKQYSPYFSTFESYLKDFPLKQVVVLTRYHQRGIKKLLRHAKFYKKYAAYRDIIIPFSDFFIHYLKKESIFIPVPLHILRQWKRGFNQSEKIALILSEVTNISYNKKLLFRKKYTKHQSHLSKIERQTMLFDAFFVKIQKNIPKHTTLYLVDDVISSGSTLIECAKVLQAAGYQDIRAVVLSSD